MDKKNLPESRLDDCGLKNKTALESICDSICVENFEAKLESMEMEENPQSNSDADPAAGVDNTDPECKEESPAGEVSSGNIMSYTPLETAIRMGKTFGLVTEQMKKEEAKLHEKTMQEEEQLRKRTEEVGLHQFKLVCVGNVCVVFVIKACNVYVCDICLIYNSGLKISTILVMVEI